MNYLAQPNESEGTPTQMDGDLNVATGRWELKVLKPMHRQVASLCAQGMKNVDIASVVGITPEYVSMLLRQPLVKEYIAEMCEVVGVRMEALFEKSVDVIADVMETGNNKERIAAARLQLEATKRIGRPDPNAGMERSGADRLERLANRLIELQSGVRSGKVFNENGQEITDA